MVRTRLVGRLPRLARVLATTVGLVVGMWILLGMLKVQPNTISLRIPSALLRGAPTDGDCSGTAASSCLEELSQNRADVVRNGMLHAWAGYKAFAWGADEIHPKSKSAKNDIMGGAGIAGMGVSIVDALSTLKLMGLHEEFAEGRDWVVGKLDFDRNTTISFFETVIRILGGLVAAHDLSGDAALGDKARELADRLLPGFDSAPTGLLQNTVSLPWVVPDDGMGTAGLAQMGSNVLEFASVSRITGNDTYRQKAEKGLRAVHQANTKALLLDSVDRQTGLEKGSIRGVGAGTDSYYEYLIKYWVLGGRRDEHFRQRWEQVLDEVLAELVVHPHGWPFSYASDSRDGVVDSSVDHLRCFFPGSVALGVMAGAVGGGDKARRYLEFAGNMTHSCFQLYNQTATGLGAERLYIDLKTGTIQILDTRYLQRPEVIESIFYMWRATKDQQWRDMGWQMWQAIERYAKYDGGYSGSTNVTEVPPPADDVTQSWFFAETLKYFYLLFSPDSALSLEDWVLNTEAHPLRLMQHPTASERR